VIEDASLNFISGRQKEKTLSKLYGLAKLEICLIY
jgi:hypothetical protein